jgi:hypothetical protein
MTISSRAAIALAALAAACGSAPPRPPAPPPLVDDPADEVTLSANAPALLTAEVALVDPGPPPRMTLRYQPQAGVKQAAVVELVTGLVLSVGEMSPPEVRTPVLRLTLELEARGVDAREGMTLEGKLVKVEARAGSAPPAVVKALGAEVDRLAGTPFSARVSRRGLLEHLTFPAPTGEQVAATASWIREALQQLLPPLPAQAVGAGARWQARRRAQVGPATADQSALYTLTELAGPTHVRLAVKLTFTAGQQTPTVAGLPPGSTFKLSSLTGTGTGTVDLDLQRLPPRTDLRWSTVASGATEPPGEPPANVKMTTTASVVIEPVGGRLGGP